APRPGPRAPLCGGTASAEGHELVGRKGRGVRSCAVAVPPGALVKRIGRYREGLAQAQPVGKLVNTQVATFAQTHCAETTAQAHEDAREAFPWYIQKSLEKIAALGAWRAGTNLGSYEYARQILAGLS